MQDSFFMNTAIIDLSGDGLRRLESALEEFCSVRLNGECKVIRKFEVKSFLKSLNLNEDYYYVGILSKFKDFNAYIMMIMDTASADEFISRMTGKHLYLLDEFNESALQELANVTVGILSSQLSKGLGRRVDYSIPTTAVDFPSALLDLLLAEISESESTKCIEISFTSNSLPIFTKMLVFGDS